MLRLLVAVCLLLTSSPPLAARGVRYTLDREHSQVGFEVAMGPDVITGTIPIRSAEVELDFERTGRSRIAIELDTGGARASFPFATQALRGPKVLASRAYPTLSFHSSDLRTDGERGQLVGQLTLRGQTRPITLDAQLFRQRGSAAGDLSRLSVRLTGALRRSDFGATGWSDMVGDRVVLKILVRIDRAR